MDAKTERAIQRNKTNHRPLCDRCGYSHAYSYIEHPTGQHVRVCMLCQRFADEDGADYTTLLQVIAKRRGHLNYKRQRSRFVREPTQAMFDALPRS